MPGPVVQVILHVVGLSVLSSGIQQDPGLHILLPRVVYISPNTPIEIGRPVSVARMGGLTSPYVIRETKHVEDHVALIVFRTANFDRVKNWGNVTTLAGTSNTYSYLRLNGERIGFDLGHPSTAGVLPKGFALPKLPALCGGTATLKPAYLPPNYPGTAAVFDVPSGSVKACLATSGMRIDSEITLTANGVLLLYSGIGPNRKELQLKAVNGKVDLFVANIPVSCLSGQCGHPQATDLNGVSHVRAYYDMGAGNTSSCTMTVTKWLEDHPPSLDTCSLSVPGAAGGNGMYGGMRAQGDGSSSRKTEMADFECSNSQWP